ncbi:proprotein convertase P-domain-containing protein [Streptomyces sp. 3211]|uniref:proprotein convertase P-domain-containing protein n=1 Tax=Streptomyces sp. 3211 TaxID=1964449 RepID=UPI00214FADB9|nr:proprotein convertase P-domain-containing protein [Streptomyces sp. 3211]
MWEALCELHPGQSGGQWFGNFERHGCQRSGRRESTADLRVKVNIVHHTRGDLALDLIAPDGTSYRFYHPNSDTGNDLFQEFNVDASSEAPNGQWKLKITDTKADSETFDGRLDRWMLQF